MRIAVQNEIVRNIHGILREDYVPSGTALLYTVQPKKPDPNKSWIGCIINTSLEPVPTFF